MYYKIISMNNHETWAPAVGGGGKRRRCPPPGKIMKIKDLQLIHPYGGLFRYVRAFLLLFHLWRLVFAMWGLFCYFFTLLGAFLRCGDFFWLAPHPTKISASTHGPCHDINLNFKFVENVSTSA